MNKLNDQMRLKARARVDAYMRHAANVIKLHGNTSNDLRLVSHSLSAVKLQLKALLGKELTKQLWAADEGLCLYYWSGDQTEKITQEHVIPLGVLIEHMANYPDLYCDSKEVRQFLLQHLTVAWIPQTLGNALTTAKLRSRMPEASQWHLADPDENLKQDRIWGRYAELKRTEVAPPHVAGSMFKKYPRELSWGIEYRGQ